MSCHTLPDADSLSSSGGTGSNLKVRISVKAYTVDLGVLRHCKIGGLISAPLSLRAVIVSLLLLSNAALKDMLERTQ